MLATSCDADIRINDDQYAKDAKIFYGVMSFISTSLVQMSLSRTSFDKIVKSG